VNGVLQATLGKLIQSRSRSNPAMNALMSDYILFHVVRVVAGGLLIVIFVLLSRFFWIRWKRLPWSDERKWTFERKTYFAFGILSTVVGLLIAFVVVVNAATVLHPWPGFSWLVDSLETPKTGTPMDKLYQAFNTWLQSGSPSIPPLIQQRIQERIALHTTRVIVCGILLVAFAVLSKSIWSTLVKRSRAREPKWTLKEGSLLVCGAASVTLSLVLMVIVEVNLRWAFAQLTVTLLYG
jgi:hypothetical protein